MGINIVLEVISVLILLIALVLTVVAVGTPQWQVAEMGELNQIHHNGLWEDCVYGSRGEEFMEWICTMKIYDQEGQATGRHRHKPEQWRLTVLILMSLASFLGLFALLVAALVTCADSCRIASCGMASKITWLCLCMLAMLTCSAGVIIFARNSQDIENRVELQLVERALLQLGMSFYLAVSAAVFFFISTLLSAACLVLGRFFSQSQEQNSRTPKTFGRIDERKTLV